MTTERDSKEKQVEFTCDTCGLSILEEDIHTHEDFIEAWESLKRDGWRCYRDDNEWLHKCPKCMKGSRR
jgi:predicted RNA-binding Zn-ribbon protein involved in translation (DUF1610 family)